MIQGSDQTDAKVEPAGLSGEAGGGSITTGPFFCRPDWLAFGLTFLTALTVYLDTLAPEVTLEFSGILSASAMYAGVAYPPGFPVWTLYSALFVKLLPFGNIASRVAVGSAVAAALACALVALLVSRLGAMVLETTPAFTRLKPMEQTLLRLACGYVGGVALGLSQTVWRVAVVAEIWALSVLLFALLFCLLTRWMANPARRRFLYGAWFVFGLMLTSNQELIVITPGLLAFLLLSDRELGRDLALLVALLAVPYELTLGRYCPAWRGLDYLSGNVWLMMMFLVVGIGAAIVATKTRQFGSAWRPGLLCGLFFLLGLGCYFYLPIASMTNPPMNWAYPRTAEGFIHLITRGQYERPNILDGLTGCSVEQVWTLTSETGNSFGWPYLVFALFPLCVLHRANRPARKWLLGLAAMSVCLGPLVVAALNPGADVASRQLVAPHFGPLYVLVAVWAGLGLMVLGSRLAEPRVRSDLLK
jgi:hypothetical protein